MVVTNQKGIVMNPFLCNKLRDDFLIRLNFGIINNSSIDEFYYAGLKKAYLDFNRTLKISDKKTYLNNKKQCEILLIKFLRKMIIEDFESQSDFDLSHKKICILLKSQWSDLTFGQAQKWINMTLKYWLVFGESRIKGIDKNAKFFHIPLDSYVLKGMLQLKKYSPWSKINSYEDYMKYQNIHRNNSNNKNPPIVEEFIFFNLFDPNQKIY